MPWHDSWCAAQAQLRAPSTRMLSTSVCAQERLHELRSLCCTSCTATTVDVRGAGRIFWLDALLVAAHEDAALMLDKPVLFAFGAPTRAGAAPCKRVAHLARGATVVGLVPGIDGA